MMVAGRQALEATRRAQSHAADPAASAWVSANAGTGKTYVLTSRVLRLLLAGTPPERILALTYTKAAAAEMSKRVFGRLGQWVTLPLDALKIALAETLDRPATQEELDRARTLFAHAIETPGGLKVQTIHAFCERLLQRFPLEAGVAPGFSILDDVTGADLLRAATDDVLARAVRDRKGALGHALLTAVGHAADDSFDAILRDALSRRDWLEGLSRLALVEADAGDLYRKAFGLDAAASRDRLEAACAAVLSDTMIDRAIVALGDGGKRDQATADALHAAKLAASRKERIDALSTALLTKEGVPRADSQFIAKAVRSAEPALTEALCRARDEFAQRMKQTKTLEIIEATLALATLADAVMQNYGEAKARRAALDFDDLIRKTSSLFGRVRADDGASVAEWVLYKLDGGLDHILVDEAQDTSRAQWAVVEAIAEEFFAGSGARDIVRTMFAVGDEKQSIYGFQGAAPKMFAEMGKVFEKRAAEAGQVWRRVPLTLSFRTVEPILRSVDGVFSDAKRTPGLTAGGSLVAHAANRVGQAGFVEIWPTEKPQEAVDSDPWSPLDDQASTAPVVRLAQTIAVTIDQWLKSGEILQSENRAVRAGDIIILVRRRRPFAPVMVAALKARGIAVAGADRLVLIEQIAVQDLVVLCDFLVLPEDDLALATVLKSPLFGLDDTDLLHLAYDRPGQLWTALLKAAQSNERYREAADMLRQWRSEADFMPPYEFLASVLERDGGRFRERLLRRLGQEASDPLDELLNLALQYDSKSPPSLQGFLTWLRASRQEIKRDMEQGRDEVRVMTVHGAKGLEAPIVFLPDTCSSASGGRAGGLLRGVDLKAPLPSTLDELMLWPVKGTKSADAIVQARGALSDAEAEERNRLLYVSMTRARDRLYVAGYEGKTARPADCWYSLIDDALGPISHEVVLAEGRTVRRIEEGQTVPHERPRDAHAEAVQFMQRPDWWRKPAPVEPQLAMPLAPSRLAPLETDEDGELREPRRIEPLEPAQPPASTVIDQKRFLRGTLTHALLEHLPGLPSASWSEAAATYLDVRASDLSVGIRRSIASETLKVLEDPQFAHLFGPQSQAEVPVVAVIERPKGKGPPLRVTGQIDRLVRHGNQVTIVDYKTNRPPPMEASAVAEAYLYQLAAYRLVLRRIFTGSSVSAVIFWTDGPRLMPISDHILDTYAEKLWTLDSGRLDGR